MWGCSHTTATTHGPYSLHFFLSSTLFSSSPLYSLHLVSFLSHPRVVGQRMLCAGYGWCWGYYLSVASCSLHPSHHLGEAVDGLVDRLLPSFPSCMSSFFLFLLISPLEISTRDPHPRSPLEISTRDFPPEIPTRDPHQRSPPEIPTRDLHQRSPTEIPTPIRQSRPEKQRRHA